MPNEELDDDSEDEDTTILVHIKASEPSNYEARVRQKFLNALISNLQNRFPQVDVLEAFSILDPAGLLGQEVMSEEYLDTLLNHYDESGPLGIPKAACVKEYNDFVTFVTAHAKLKSCKTLQELGFEVLSKDSINELFPHVSKLLIHSLVLPVSTTDCERCFSNMNRTKTDLRNRMTTCTLNRLLRIQIEGPDESDFDFSEIVHRWSKAKNRRLFN